MSKTCWTRHVPEEMPPKLQDTGGNKFGKKFGSDSTFALICAERAECNTKACSGKNSRRPGSADLKTGKHAACGEILGL